jgi:hypothetical protein
LAGELRDDKTQRIRAVSFIGNARCRLSAAAQQFTIVGDNGVMASAERAYLPQDCAE